MKTRLSTAVVISLCGLSFLFGRFLQIVPSLPESKLSGSKEVAEEHKAAVPVRQTLEQIHEQEVHPPPPLTPKNFEEAVHPLLHERPPLHPAETGRPNYLAQPSQVLSWYPRMLLFPKFLSDEQCDRLVEVAEARLAPSALALRTGDTAEGTRNIRTSQGTFMSHTEDPSGTLTFIEEKIATLTGLPTNYGEAFNILRYKLGQHYDSHFDYFEETGYGKLGSNRLATVLVYLSSVELGGETVFPWEGRDGLARQYGMDFKNCDMGFKYKPRKGDALLFYSMYPNNTLDRHSLHGGCPVIRGEKWVATKWVRNKCYSDCHEQ